MRQESSLSDYYCHSPGYIIEPLNVEALIVNGYIYNAIYCFDTITISDISSLTLAYCWPTIVSLPYISVLLAYYSLSPLH